MKLPIWLRHLMSKILVNQTSEVAGVLFDYAGGKWKELEEWNTQEIADQALNVVDNMFDRGVDAIYVAMIRVNGSSKAGYFVYFDSIRDVKFRFFWQGLYDFNEALTWIDNRCVETARRMGYHVKVA